VFKGLQQKIYSGRGKNHGDLIKNMPDSYEQFYQMLASLKHAGRNVNRILDNEEKLYDATKNREASWKIIGPIHEETGEQTKYFMINIHSGIEKLHKYLAKHFNLEDININKTIIQSALMNNPKTEYIGEMLRQTFYHEKGFRVINALRNSLIHENPGYSVVRYIAENEEPYPTFQTFALKIYENEYDSMRAMIVNPNEKLKALSIHNYQIPGNSVMLHRSMTIDIPELFPNIQKPAEKEKFKEEHNHSLNNIIQAQIPGITPTFQLAPTVVGIYDYICYNTGIITSESLNNL
jgi:hypothetical protein